MSLTQGAEAVKAGITKIQTELSEMLGDGSQLKDLTDAAKQLLTVQESDQMVIHRHQKLLRHL